MLRKNIVGLLICIAAMGITTLGFAGIPDASGLIPVPYVFPGSPEYFPMMRDALALPHCRGGRSLAHQCTHICKHIGVDGWSSRKPC